MATTQSRLEQLESNLDESIGVRRPTTNRTSLSPIPSPKDVGRRPLRHVGRIQIDQVIPDPSQPRREFSPESIQRLASSIREKGQLAPIRVRWEATIGKWVIVYGERRWRAARAAKADAIDCHFEERDASEAEILEQQMIENLLREDLKPIEQARGFAALMELHGWNGKQVAQSLHVPASTVSRALALLDLPEDIQHQVDAGRIAARSAYEISKVDNRAKQEQLAAKAAQGMTLKQTKEAVRKRSRGRKAPERAPKQLKFLAENGWKVAAIPPRDGRLRTYDDLHEALKHVMEDVQTRIHANVRIA